LPLSVFAALGDDGGGGLSVAVEGVARDDAALEIDEPQHLERRLDLVALLGCYGGQRELEARGEGRDHHLRGEGLALVVGALQRLAVDGDDAALGQDRDEPGGQLTERGVERLRIEHAEHGRERVVRGDAVPELQETLEKPDLSAPKSGHLRAVLRTAEHREEGDDQYLSERVARVFGSRTPPGTAAWPDSVSIRSPLRIHDLPICKRDPLRSYAIPLPGGLMPYARVRPDCSRSGVGSNCTAPLERAQDDTVSAEWASVWAIDDRASKAPAR
jgi:hypothetical protein